MLSPYFLILFLIFLVILNLVSLGGFSGAPWFPTKKRDFDRIAKLAKLQPGMLFYDLGSGTGEMLFYLSKKYNITCIGIEFSPFLYLYSKFKSLFFKGVKIEYGNFFKHDLSKANVIYIFLLPKTYDKLKKKLNSELKEGAKIILSCWPFEYGKPVRISEKENSITYYLYIMQKEKNYLL